MNETETKPAENLPGEKKNRFTKYLSAFLPHEGRIQFEHVC